MSGEFIGIDVHGLKELQEKFSRLPDAAIDAGTEEANRYIIDYERSKQPSYKYVSMAQAGYKISPAQIRFFFASGIWESDGEGGVKLNKYKRTQDLASGWKVLGRGKDQIVVNEAPGAKWVKDIRTQSQMMFLRGWTVIQEDVKDRMPEIIRKFEAGVKKAIHKLGLD